MWSFPFGCNKRRTTDITVRHTFGVFLSLVFPLVCHSNHKVLWQNRALCETVNWFSMGQFSWHELSGCWVQSPVHTGLLERFCGHSSRRRCPALLALFTYFIEVCKGLNSTELPFHQVFRYAQENGGQIWSTHWCWLAIVARFWICLTDLLLMENLSFLKCYLMIAPYFVHLNPEEKYSSDMLSMACLPAHSSIS